MPVQMTGASSGRFRKVAEGPGWQGAGSGVPEGSGRFLEDFGGFCVRVPEGSSVCRCG